VAVHEYVGFNNHPLANRPLDRKAAAIDFGLYPLDRNPHSTHLSGQVLVGAVLLNCLRSFHLASLSWAEFWRAKLRRKISVEITF
jgi:hypothetical protein